MHAIPIKAQKLGYIIFILLLTVPIVEIGVFIEVGGRIGLWPTIAVIFVTAAIISRIDASLFSLPFMGS